MSYGMHIVKRKEVMSGYQALHGREEQFDQVLDALNIERCSDMSNENERRFELPKEDLKRGRRILRRIVNGTFRKDDYVEKEQVLEAIENCDTTPEEMLEVLNAIWKFADKKNGYILINWY